MLGQLEVYFQVYSSAASNDLQEPKANCESQAIKIITAHLRVPCITGNKLKSVCLRYRRISLFPPASTASIANSKSNPA